jgi:hypothetical protein
MLTKSSFKVGASSAPSAESTPRLLIDSRLRPELTKWDALPRASGEAGVDHSVVQISPPDLVRRRTMTWHGVTAESVQCTSWDKGADDRPTADRLMVSIDFSNIRYN